jgi:hypothetical protein
MRVLSVVFILFLLNSLDLQAQDNTLPPGLLWEDEAYMKLTVYADSTKSGGRRKVDMTPYCPTPGDQCHQLSCVGWAIVYNMTIRRAYQCRQKNRAWIDARMLSPAFIYNKIKEGKTCDAGAYLTKGLALAQEKGVPLLTTMPYECDICSKTPNKQQEKEAANYRITEIRRLYGLRDAAEARIEKTQAALDNNEPVIVAIMVTPEFKTITKKDVPWIPNKKEVLGGNVEGHAIVVVGYDEDKREFTLLNSYGTAWGEDGFLRMSFEDFGKQARYGVVAGIGWVDCGK